jgi:hypothetical protein
MSVPEHGVRVCGGGRKEEDGERKAQFWATRRRKERRRRRRCVCECVCVGRFFCFIIIIITLSSAAVAGGKATSGKQGRGLVGA